MCVITNMLKKTNFVLNVILNFTIMQNLLERDFRHHTCFFRYVLLPNVLIVNAGV